MKKKKKKKIPVCLICGRKMIEQIDMITKKKTGYIWWCKCMSKNMELSIG